MQVFLRTEVEAEDAADGRPALTTEYDVFECDAFVKEQGKWLKLMLLWQKMRPHRHLHVREGEVAERAAG